MSVLNVLICSLLNRPMSIFCRGSYRNDVRNGKGMFKLSEGDTYEGEFLDGNVMLLKSRYSSLLNSTTISFLSIADCLGAFTFSELIQ